MSEGLIQQVGTPEEVYSRPPNKFVAEFVGEMNFIKGEVAGDGQVSSVLGKRAHDLPAGCGPGDAVTLAIRPQHIALAPQANAAADTPTGTIRSRTYLGDSVLYEVDVSDTVLMARLEGESRIDPGQTVALVLAG